MSETQSYKVVTFDTVDSFNAVSDALFARKAELHSRVGAANSNYALTLLRQTEEAIDQLYRKVPA